MQRALLVDVWRFPSPSRTRGLYISQSTRTDFSGPWHVQAGLTARGALFFFSLASLSEYPGRLATHGWNCVLAVRDGGVLHSSPLSINSLAGQLLSVLQLWIVNWVALDTFIDRHTATL